MLQKKGIVKGPVYNRLRAFVRSNPVLNEFIMKLIRRKWINDAAKFMKTGNLFIDDLGYILEDYTFSICKTHRTIMQVLNLEIVLRSLERKGIRGAIVETGVYTGGASAYALKAMQRICDDNKLRDYWGFDSFEGMPNPSKDDGELGKIWIKGSAAAISENELGMLVGNDTNKSDYNSTLSYLHDTNYPRDKIHLIKGWFQNTLPVYKDCIGPIAVLRLDGDFYESTKIVYNELYEQVVDGGVIIVDDYGAFEGCKKATDEFLQIMKLDVSLIYVDDHIRYFVKKSP